METLKTCPVCNHSVTQPFLQVKDHFLSSEEFRIVECIQCGFRYLNPRPDSTEISRYYDSPEYTSHDTGKKSVFNFVYKLIRSQAVRKKYQLITKNTKGKRLLDIGCGTAEFIAWCGKKGMMVTGVEPNPKAREYAKTRHGIAVFPEGALETISPASFDVITLWHVLEHVHDLNRRMERIGDMLSPGGLLVIAVPNSDSWDACYYKEAWAAYDPPRHLYHFTKETISRLAQKHEFETIGLLPMKWDAFYVSLLSEKYQNGSGNILKAIRSGFLSNLNALHRKKNYSSQVFLFKRPENAK